MNLLITLLVTTTLAAHAALGCCIHLGVCASSSSANHHCEHDDHQAAPGDHQPVPEKCDEQCCVFVASRAIVGWSIELAGFYLPPCVCTSPLLAASPTLWARMSLEDTHYPAGPALHVWQCHWAI